MMNKAVNKFILIFTAVFLSVSLSACNTVSIDEKNNNLQTERRTVITASIIEPEFKSDVSSADVDPIGIYISDMVKEKMAEYEGQDVWFRILAKYHGLRTNNCDSELNYAMEIGAVNIVKNENCSDVPELYSSYFMEVTADMITKISERYAWKIYLAPPARQGNYSSKISDALTCCLSEMDDDDTIEIAAVCIWDNKNDYARQQNVPMNYNYNSELFQLFEQGRGLTYAECDALIEQTMVDIMTRNGILEKRVISDDLPTVGFGEVRYSHAAFLDDITVGFNAVLNKAEILKLAEDEEIKVIYLAPQE